MGLCKYEKPPVVVEMLPSNVQEGKWVRKDHSVRRCIQFFGALRTGPKKQCMNECEPGERQSEWRQLQRNS